jgi:hypothetical protein
MSLVGVRLGHRDLAAGVRSTPYSVEKVEVAVGGRLTLNSVGLIAHDLTVWL